MLIFHLAIAVCLFNPAKGETDKKHSRLNSKWLNGILKPEFFHMQRDIPGFYFIFYKDLNFGLIKV